MKKDVQTGGKERKSVLNKTTTSQEQENES